MHLDVTDTRSYVRVITYSRNCDLLGHSQINITSLDLSAIGLLKYQLKLSLVLCT